ncbi:phosphoadenylyl-sulfate reductase [Malaciobacter molluscorum LMG 25693]|uniref:Adenosine 5'-phosphosulfate reductase n=1 Tax=Malaciobacter molluscorum LMG 25693 TaxID=870501 RepID=A0A2G1DHC3_9BACT|nr:phosphoadenylyl-sulfate reductase [Malaciobacter molluscorum]AXX93681.1 phosphoadenosine phosphosulfate reductase [Malaciobacter molluscorum LMG 25693]PHO17909.1 phosphoadenylyl-sulfate reductase [Malaciobacter molluscorum LMG 25693]
MEIINKLNEKLKDVSTLDVIEFFLKGYKNKIALASSLGAEDQVLTDMILKTNKDTKIFTLDTGRLNPETYNVMDATNLKYSVKLDVYFPKLENVEKLYKTQGVNGHFESIDNRKNCCNIRKIEPLKRALEGLDVWFTGLRSSQSVTREDMKLVEWDEAFGLIKVNPLINWNEEDVWTYIKENSVPYNKLHDQGYPSIGCAPCTRAVKDGEDIRAGRWWWENPEHKECGLHKK